jgi:CxxC motif-containing protein (DUF1111 family)
MVFVTLVLGYLNTDHAVLAVDRRITMGGEPIDDSRAKSLFWENSLMVAFTGLAELGVRREETMRWLAGTLAPYSPPTTLDLHALGRSLASIASATRASDRDRRIALLGLGYTDSGPTYFLVSNMHADTGEQLTEARGDCFVSVLRLTARSTIRVVGAEMPETGEKGDG